MCKGKYHSDCEVCDKCGKDASIMLRRLRGALCQITDAVENNTILIAIEPSESIFRVEMPSMTNAVDKYSSKATH